MYPWTEPMKTQVCLRAKITIFNLKIICQTYLTPLRTTMTSCMER